MDVEEVKLRNSSGLNMNYREFLSKYSAYHYNIEIEEQGRLYEKYPYNHLTVTVLLPTDVGLI